MAELTYTRVVDYYIPNLVLDPELTELSAPMIKCKKTPRKKCHLSADGIVVYTALFHNITCRYEACQALIYQPVLDLTGENGKYNYSKAVHVYPLFSDITCSAKNYKIAPALTVLKAQNG